MGKVIEREDLPVVAINLLTKDRPEFAIQTIHAALRHLKYDGKLSWVISDNGSTPENSKRVQRAIPNPTHYFNEGTIGACWNGGLKYIFSNTDIYLRLEDDMRLKGPLDITPYVKILMTEPMVGMIRLGQMVQDLVMLSRKFKTFTHIGWDEDIYFDVGKHMSYAFSGHPCLIHKRFHDAYGYFPEEPLTAGEIEVRMDAVFRNTSNSNIAGIYFPHDMGRFGTWGAWDHIGTEKA